MTKLRGVHKKRVVRAHTVKDARYKRRSHLHMMYCPACYASGCMTEEHEGRMVWADCSHNHGGCGASGKSHKMLDGAIVEAVDLCCTIADANQ